MPSYGLQYKIEFTIEKRFNDCKNNLPLPFDFYIKSKSMRNILIGILLFPFVLQAQSNSIQAAHYNILNQTAQAQLAAANYELRTKQAEDAKIAAMPILDAMQTTDPKTGNVSITWSSNPTTFKQQLAAANAVTHIDYEKLYNNPDVFTGHIQTIKNGLADSNQIGRAHV